MATQPILVIGAGEIGTAILDALLANTRCTPSTTPITLLVRPLTLSSPSLDRRAQLGHFRSQGIFFLSGDTDMDSLDYFTDLFRPFHTVIGAGGFTSSNGTQLKLAQAAVAAGVPLYFPWQYGVDYDLVGPEGGNGLFAEQCQVRELLRSQSKTQWVIVSVGIFMSFLFQEFWGVVKKEGDGRVEVTVLNSWDDWITATAAEDIGKVTAELALNAKEERNKAVFVAGDALTYRHLADLVESVVGKEVLMDVRPLAYSKEEAAKNPDNKLETYRVVFSEGKGLSWPKAKTWNAERAVEMVDIRTWLTKNWK
jgi:NmrA-like family